ncbi:MULTISPECIES: GNAT family N-acetyltransferase [Catenuloplanes]|uniref:RimJ/RimL family protein N-acetyltransferase n=1 Tax=Catenuloplanes niger TaxID=587534 RepID=A0AAE3ZWQ6_9ACTN|nr:GNAT family protein [Catenuloplanes niger]MDR7326589.1 RimJ/RimL family protein N-acetyltransferase [Catenuloplanes niger]
MPARPLPVLCRPTGLHVTQTDRLWLVTDRVTDHARWARQAADDPAPAAEWPAELLRHGRGVLLGPVADAIVDGDGRDLLPPDPDRLFVAAINRSTHRLIGGVSLTGHHLLGGIDRAERRRGYGHEMLSAVCRLAHRHFDLARLTAVCTPGNEPARRWLAAAGFTPDGATWEHTDPGHTLRCPGRRPRR